MYVIGKLVGAFLGYLIAGPFGALFGAIFGNLFDKGLLTQMNPYYPNFAQETRLNVINLFIKTSACLMGCMAKADGRVSEAEIGFANHVFRKLKLNHKQKSAAIEWFTISKNGQISVQDQQRLLFNLKELNLTLCRSCLDIIYQMANIDGLTAKKVQILNQLLQAAGFAPLQSEFESSDRSSAQSSAAPGFNLSKAYAILDLTPNAAQPEVKKNYRKLIGKYHPDRLIAKGASSAELKFATEKTQEISKAYQYICAAKGW